MESRAKTKPLFGVTNVLGSFLSLGLAGLVARKVKMHTTLAVVIMCGACSKSHAVCRKRACWSQHETEMNSFTHCNLTIRVYTFYLWICSGFTMNIIAVI